MGINTQGSTEQFVASAMEIQQELEIFSKFELGVDSGWGLWSGGGSGGLIVLSWSLGLELLHSTALTF